MMQIMALALCLNSILASAIVAGAFCLAGACGRKGGGSVVESSSLQRKTAAPTPASSVLSTPIAPTFQESAVDTTAPTPIHMVVATAVPLPVRPTLAPTVPSATPSPAALFWSSPIVYIPLPPVAPPNNTPPPVHALPPPVSLPIFGHQHGHSSPVSQPIFVQQHGHSPVPVSLPSVSNPPILVQHSPPARLPTATVPTTPSPSSGSSFSPTYSPFTAQEVTNAATIAVLVPVAVVAELLIVIGLVLRFRRWKQNQQHEGDLPAQSNNPSTKSVSSS